MVCWRPDVDVSTSIVCPRATVERTNPAKVTLHARIHVVDMRASLPRDAGKTNCILDAFPAGPPACRTRGRIDALQSTRIPILKSEIKYLHTKHRRVSAQLTTLANVQVSIPLSASTTASAGPALKSLLYIGGRDDKVRLRHQHGRHHRPTRAVRLRHHRYGDGQRSCHVPEHRGAGGNGVEAPV